MWRGLFRDKDIHALALFVRGENLLLVVVTLGVDFPGVEFGAAEESQGGVMAGEHGVVLVVVAVHAVAAHGLEVGEAVEEGAVETIAKAVSDPVLKRILGQEGLDPRLHIAGEHHEALEDAEVANGVQDLERVLVKLISVKNAGHPWHLEHRLIHHVGPQTLHILALREKPAATNVDAVLAPAVGARDAADVRRSLKKEWVSSLLRQLESRSELGGASTDNEAVGGRRKKLHSVITRAARSSVQKGFPTN